MMDEYEFKQEELEIFHAHPRLFRTALAPKGQRECMAYGLSVSMGWFPIIKRLSEQLDEIASRHGLPEDMWPRVVQVKEKFGQLRYTIRTSVDIYETPAGREMYEAKELAEEESLIVCERCGAPGTMRKEGWWHVYCDHCEDLYKRGLDR